MPKHTKNKPQQRDKALRRMNCLFVFLIAAVLAYGVYDAIQVYISNAAVQETTTQTTTKEVEKVVNGKLEKTKEVQTVEKPNEPTGISNFIAKKFNEPSYLGTFLLVFGLLCLVFIFKMFAGLLFKDLTTVNIGVLGAGAAAKETAAIAQESRMKSTQLELLARYNTSKFKQDFYDEVMKDFDTQNPNVMQFLTKIAERIVADYEKEFDAYLDYDVVSTSDLKSSKHSSIVTNTVNAIDPNTGYAIGKEDGLAYHQNHLVCRTVDAFEEYEVAVIFSSFQTQFKEDDERFLTSMCSIAVYAHKEYKYADAIAIQDTELEASKRLNEELVAEFERLKGNKTSE